MNHFPRIYIGFDKHEAAAYWVLKDSIQAGGSFEIRPLVTQMLEMCDIYKRPRDPLASTEFTYTRFLVPSLTNYRGWALFIDSDMLCRGDMRRLFSCADPKYAVMCVQHDHRPTEPIKMGGRVQTVYPRKNWSSCMLFNCGHPANAALTPDVVNRETGEYLHQFKWLDDDLIGELPVEYNYLVGWNTPEECDNPLLVHFTEGVPGIHKGYDNVPFAKEYFTAVSRSCHNAYPLPSAA